VTVSLRRGSGSARPSVALGESATSLSLENVPNLLVLHGGAGMRFITGMLEDLGYYWAYRTVDSRFTGVPQRRPRIIMLAGKDDGVVSRLLGEDSIEPASLKPQLHDPHGFYWTEGRTGLGLVRLAVPTLKGGSTLGLPSAPAIWLPANQAGRKFVLPTVEDGEALQGLPRGWTSAARRADERDLRWKLVGNAVTVGVARWIGERLSLHEVPRYDGEADQSIDRSRRWPKAGWGSSEAARKSPVSAFPRRANVEPIGKVVAIDEATALSHRATAGFLSRLDESGRRVSEELYAHLEEHLAATRPALSRQGSWASSDDSRRRMRSQRSTNTKPEIVLRRALHARGLRYRLQYRPDPTLRIRVDIAFVGARVAVDVRGCFWHSCPEHRTFPKANAERWAEKLERNVERDATTEARLADAGWHVEVVWEHDDPDDVAVRIDKVVRERTRQR
jgi:DNA mismatch endonuclease Vsr